MVLIIAEAGVNHNGSLELAKELVTKITKTSLTEVGEKQMREGPRELDNPGI